MEKNSSVDHFFIQSHLDVEIGPANLQKNVKIPFFGAHHVQTFGLARNLLGSFARNFWGKLM